jgi:hypothetical protein
MFVCYFYPVDKRKKKRNLFVIGLIIGIAVGEAMHHLALGIAFGILLGLIMRELYERKTGY